MNDNQNPNVVNNVPTTDGLQPASPNGVQAVPSSVGITVGVEQAVTQTGPIQATPVPVQNPAPVQATPMPAQNTTPVVATPVQTNGTDSPFFTPESVQPDTQVSPELPPIAPVAPAAPVAAPTPSAPETPTVPPTEGTTAPGLEVIQTAPKRKTSNFIIILFLVLLILFVFNIDTVITIYDQYKNAGNPQNPINKNTNNLTDGYIKINENASSIKLKDIKFYNFRQTQGKGITFSYEVLAKIDDAKALEIYIELYNSEKEIIYKELYNPSQKLEKDTVRTYIMDVDKEIYDVTFYALVKVYTEQEKNDIKTLACSKEDKKYIYKNKYTFTNNGLTSYDVEKTSKIEDDANIKKEYESLLDVNNATYDDHVLRYTVDLSKDNGELIIPYEKDTAMIWVKNNLTSKEWNCE